MINDARITAALTSLIAALILYLHPKLDASAAASIGGLVVSTIIALFTRPPGGGGDGVSGGGARPATPR